MEIYDLVIVGAGPAGLAAAIYGSERKLNLVIVESDKPGGQLTNLYPQKSIYDFPSYSDIKAKDLAEKMVIHTQGLEVKILTGTTITRVEKKDPRFLLKNDTAEFWAKAVILATGMGYYQARKLSAMGEAELKGKGIYYQMLPDKVLGKRVVVVGGGDTAFETAVAATEMGGSVTIVHRSQEFRALEKTRDKAKSLSIPIITSARVIEFHGSEKLDNVEILRESGSSSFLTADYVAICIGVELNSTFINQLGISVDRQAVGVDENMQTSIPGMFACGDIIVPAGKYRRISIAVGSAATAINGVYQYLKRLPDSPK